MKTAILRKVLLLAAMAIWAAGAGLPAQSNQMYYRVSGAMPRPIAGFSQQFSATIEYDDTTGVIESFEFDVFLYSFIDQYPAGSTPFLARLGAANMFPTMSFESNKVKQEGNELKIRGSLYFRGMYQPLTIQAVRSEKGGMIYLSGVFTLDTRDYFMFPSPPYYIPPHVEFSFEAVFEVDLPG